MRRQFRWDIIVLLAAPYDTDQRVQRSVSALSDAGYRIRVISISRAGAQVGREGAWVGRWGEEVCQLAVGEPWQGRRLLDKFLNVLLRYGPAYIRMLLAALPGARIAHANDAETLPIGWVLRSLGRSERLVWDAHEYPVEFAHGPAGSLMVSLRGVWLYIIRVLAPRADAVITVGPAIARKYQELGIGPINIVRNVPPLRTPQTGARRSQKADGLHAIFLGYLHEGSGAEIAIEACRLSRSRGASIRLRIAGPGPTSYVERLRASTEDLNGYVNLAGAVPYSEVVDLYAEHDVGLILLPPSPLTEIYLPNKLFEMLMAGLPIIASPIPDVQNILESSQCGWVFDGTAAALADTWEELCRQPETLRAAGQRGRALATESLHWGHESKALLQIYQAVE